MICLVENGTPTLIGELHGVSSGEREAIGEVYAVSGGTPALVYASGFAVTLMGAPGETVTYAGPVSGSVTLDGNGDAALALRPGVYTFTGNLSGTRADVRISRGVPVTMWPDNARILYWYGRFGLLDDGVTPQSLEIRTSKGSFSDAFCRADPHALHFMAQARRYQSYEYAACCAHFAAVSYAGYASAVYRVSGRRESAYGQPGTQLGPKSGVDSQVCPQSFFADGSHSVPLDPARPYVAASVSDGDGGETSYSSAEYDLEAVYLI